MRTFFLYLRLEIKRTIKSIPYILAGAIVLVLLAGTIAFSASKILYGDRAVERIAVGVVMPEEDPLASLALSMVSSLDSVESLCNFQYVEEAQGISMLKKGEVFALLKIPEGMVQGIMDGTNTPAVLLFSEHAGLEAAVFRELADAGISILASSQAAIYGTDGLLNQYGMETSIRQAEKELNELYLKYSLSREGYFKTLQVSATGSLSLPVFYGASAAVLVLLLTGIPAASLLQPYGRSMEQKLSLLGITRGKRTAVKTLSLMLLLQLISAVPFAFCFARGYISSRPQTFLLWFLVCLAAAGWILLIYELLENMTAGILCLFFSTVVMLFLSGGFVPRVFLPESLGNLGSILPTALLLDGVKGMVSGSVLMPVLCLTLFEAVVFGVTVVVRRDYE